MILKGYDEEGKATYQTAREFKWEQTWRQVEREQAKKLTVPSFNMAHYNELVGRAQAEMIVCGQMLEAIEAGTLKTLSIPSREADVNLIHPEHLELIAEESQRLANLNIERIGVKDSTLSTWHQQLVAAGYQADLKPFGLAVRLTGQLVQIPSDLKPLARLIFETSTGTVYCLSTPCIDADIISYVKDAEQTVRERRLFRMIARHVADACGRSWKPRWSADKLILDRIDGFGVAICIGIPTLDAKQLESIAEDESGFKAELQKLISSIK